MEILAFLEVAVEHEAPCSRQCLGQNRPSPLWGWCLKLNRPNCLGAIALLVLTINLLGHVLGAAIAQAGILAPGQILRRGNQSSLVRELQQRLRDRRFFNERVTGFYGPVTEDAVRRYQQSVGLPADGIYGPATDDRLFGVSNPQRGGATGGATQLGSRVLSNGDQGSDVSDLQQLLNERVGFTSIDGDFGDATEQRVRQLQQFAGLTVDGIVGSA
ncbi:MAG: peptidoglycan-binding protein, partial [Leptolyngbyaceae cyanobacterium]